MSLRHRRQGLRKDRTTRTTKHTMKDLNRRPLIWPRRQHGLLVNGDTWSMPPTLLPDFARPQPKQLPAPPRPKAAPTPTTSSAPDDIEFEEVYPTYSWDEGDPCKMAVTEQGTSSRDVPVYGHSSTRIPGLISLLPDTGAVGSVTGIRNLRLLHGEATSAGHEGLQWSRLQRPRLVCGVGGKAEPCHFAARITGVLKDGSALEYAAPDVERETLRGKSLICLRS